MQKTPHCLLNQLTSITNKILILKDVFMLLPQYDYFYNEISINSFNIFYLIKLSKKCEKIEINILKIEIFLITTNKKI